MQTNTTLQEIANALPAPASLDFRQAMQAIGGSELMEYFEHTDDPKEIILDRVLEAYTLSSASEDEFDTCVSHINGLKYTPELLVAGQAYGSTIYAY